jgi:hypothetical protein
MSQTALAAECANDLLDAVGESVETTRKDADDEGCFEISSVLEVREIVVVASPVESRVCESREQCSRTMDREFRRNRWRGYGESMRMPRRG